MSSGRQKDAALTPGGALVPTFETQARSIALTGAAGFIGSQLIARLEADPRVARIIALDVRLPSTADRKTLFVPVDLTQPNAPARIADALTEARVDSLVHLAFLTNPTHNSAWAHELEAIGTLHVLTACAESAIRKLILWSLTAVYGAEPQNPNFLTEDHPLRGNPGSRFVTDKIEAERQFQRYAEEHPAAVVTTLRTCTILGPTVDNFVARYLRRSFAPVLMGSDPLLQLLHEHDAIDAFRLALDGNYPGVFNIVGDGVLPVSAILRMLGKVTVPLPHALAFPLMRALWTAQVVELPPTFLNYLRYLWVADGNKARHVMGFSPRYTTKECVLAFAGALGSRAQAWPQAPSVQMLGDGEERARERAGGEGRVGTLAGEGGSSRPSRGALSTTGLSEGR